MADFHVRAVLNRLNSIMQQSLWLIMLIKWKIIIAGHVCLRQNSQHMGSKDTNLDN